MITYKAAIIMLNDLLTYIGKQDDLTIKEVKNLLISQQTELEELRKSYETLLRESKDMVKVVRCKDCKHLLDGKNPNVICIQMKSNGFCSYGEAYDKVGKWYVVDADPTYNCSKCGYASNEKTLFCPHCGAHMSE